jgi:hypothetical protein
VPYTIPDAQPVISAKRWNQLVYRLITIAGKVCRIQIPPSSCRLIENVLEREAQRADLHDERDGGTRRVGPELPTITCST